MWIIALLIVLYLTEIFQQTRREQCNVGVVTWMKPVVHDCVQAGQNSADRPGVTCIKV